ncbi:MAG: metallophosphoesterase [Bacteroidales bacterium]|jgi:predicted MPP superfamily phosphohydrolase|nr:metallophosphoesterase [Bacteroidales bacterium]
MAKIKYLHISDLHIGDKQQNGLISQTKKVLFDDIEYILTKIQTLDVVFFTGDLVQKGTKEEYILLESFLSELWKIFFKRNQNPYLLCVPGNHDLERIDDNNHPIQLVMSDWINHDIMEEYFWTPNNPYQEFVNNRFKNYMEWYKETAIKKPENLKEGFIYGDFYSSLKIDGINLGIVGLNSSFLQLHGGDVKKKIGVYNKQINNLFSEEYHNWIQKQEISILLTHHSSEWYEPKSLTDYNQEIYCNNSYIEHLCGHMHEPSYISKSLNHYGLKVHRFNSDD